MQPTPWTLQWQLPAAQMQYYNQQCSQSSPHTWQQQAQWDCLSKVFGACHVCRFQFSQLLVTCMAEAEDDSFALQAILHHT